MIVSINFSKDLMCKLHLGYLFLKQQMNPVEILGVDIKNINFEIYLYHCFI